MFCEDTHRRRSGSRDLGIAHTHITRIHTHDCASFKDEDRMDFIERFLLGSSTQSIIAGSRKIRSGISAHMHTHTHTNSTPKSYGVDGIHNDEVTGPEKEKKSLSGEEL